MPVPLDRLRDPRDVADVLRARHQRAGRLAVVYARERDRPGPARVAVVASRKVGSAVARNRAKRLLREAIRTVPLRSGVDVVLVARSACATSVFDRVSSEVGALATDLGLTTPLADVS